MLTASVIARAVLTAAVAATPQAPPSPAATERARDLVSTFAAVRANAAKALGLRGERAGVPALVKALGDGEKSVRREAAKALGRIKDARAVASLAKALRDGDMNVRYHAAHALGEVRAAEASGALLGALFDPEWCVRDEAAWALRRLADADSAFAARLAPSLTSVQGSAHSRYDQVAWILRRGRYAVKKTADPVEREEAGRVALGEDGLAGHWSFDDGNARAARDVTGRGTDGEVRGCTSAKGRVGRALRFGDGGYVELGKPGALRIGGRPFTVMAWAKSDAPDGVVVARGGAFCGFSLYLKDGVARFGIHRTQDGPTYIAAGREKVAERWVHLAGVVKRERIELFVDAKLAATARTPGLVPSECGQGMEIGFDVGNSPAEITTAFTGVIDEVKAFEAALSAAAIAKHMAPARE
jgi:hypothetical protein